MAGQLGRFQMLSSQSFKGLTKNNHIGSIYRAQPQKATEIMVQLLATHRGKTLENYLMQFPTKYFATDDDYTWEVIGSSRRNITLVEARHDYGTPVDGVEFAGVAGAAVARWRAFARPAPAAPAPRCALPGPGAGARRQCAAARPAVARWPAAPRSVPPAAPA